MKNRIKMIGGFVICATIFAFTNSENEKNKYQIIHTDNATVTVYDTIVDVNSNYSIEQFIKDKGLNPEATEIIDLSKIEDSGENNTFHNSIILEKCIDIDGEKTSTKIEKTIDKDGNIQIKKMIDGKMVEIDAADMDILLLEKELTKIDDEVQVKIIERCITENLDINLEKIIENAINGTTEDHVHVISVKTITDEDGNTTIEKTVNGEVSESDKIIDILDLTDHINMDELENDPMVFIKRLNLNDDSLDMDIEVIINSMEFNSDAPIVMRNPDSFLGKHTIAIVTRTTVLSVDNEKSNALQIENLKFYPNPTEGMLRLNFFLPEKGKTSIQVHDLIGKRVYDKTLRNFQGNFDEQIDLTQLNAGAYILSITQKNKSLAEQIIVN